MTAPHTLADALRRIEADPTLAPTRRRDLASALRRLGTLANRDLAAVPATFAAVRALTQGPTPAALGVSAKRWANIKAALAAALRHLGVAPHPRAAAALPEPWRGLRATLPEPALRYRLARFLGYCAAQGIPPAAVDDATLAAFRAWLEHGTLVPDPGRTHRQTCVAWNRAVERVPGWPPRVLAVPDRTNPIRLPPATFPAAFHADLAAWQACLAGDDLFEEAGPARPLRPATLKHVRYQVLTAAAACVRAGCPPAELQSLADLVEPARLKRGLRFLLDRHGGASTAALGELAATLVNLARHWAKLEPARLKELEAIRARLHRRVRGLTAKNRARLRQFDEPRHQLALLELPERLLRLAERQPRAEKAARLAQTALILLLLQMAPIRLANLRGLHRERHLLRPPARRGQPRTVRLVIPGEETKNGEPLDFPLPPALGRVLDLYLARHRPRLLRGADAGWLFPGAGGGPKHASSLGAQITATVRAHTGLAVNPHLFRHLAAKLLLQEAPGHYEQARRLLGHKSVDTTTLYYTGLDTARAAALYQERLLERHARLRGPGGGGRG